jgi:hypothetical protein
MNTIESDFLKTVNKHIKVDGDEIIINQVSLAEELAGKVERFIEWKDGFTEYDLLSRLYVVMVETHITEQMTLRKLYAFWLKEIDKG